jgi:exodeoxyribonuclease VII large subunit
MASKDIIYNPSELNKILLNETKNIAINFQKINIIGDIKDFRKWKRSGCSFKLYLNNDSIDCKVWESSGLFADDIKKFINTQCIVSGAVNADYFNGHRFSINVDNIKMQSNDTKLNELKLICEERNFFKNKKEINWTKITNIGLISKKHSQGYDDFCNQFKIPISLSLQEIPLEGSKTVKECCSAIKKLQNSCDIIFIIRGGGNTVEISNSFDNIKLFEMIKNAKVPIITAIGHEQDKGDKLLITKVSDYNFSTPTSLANELNDYILKAIIQKIDYLLDDNYESFTHIIEKEDNFLYNQLKDFLQNFIKCIFGGQIVKVEEEETSIIINKNNNYYKIKLNFSEKLNLTEKKINYKNMLLDAFDERNIDNIYKYFNLLNIKANNLTQDIKSLLIKLKENEKFETKYLKTVKKKINSFYLIKNKPNKVSKNNLLKNKRTLLLYKYFLEKAENVNEIRKIYKFFK